MSREIDLSKGVGKLTPAEIGYAYQRGMINDDQLREAGYEPMDVVHGDLPVHMQPETGDANTSAKTQEDLDAEQVSEEDLQPKEESLTEPQTKGFREPVTLVDDDEDEDEDEDFVEIPDNKDYDNWTNEQRRAELADRGLSVQGKKDVLNARLREYDEARAAEEG